MSSPQLCHNCYYSQFHNLLLLVSNRFPSRIYNSVKIRSTIKGDFHSRICSILKHHTHMTTCQHPVNGKAEHIDRSHLNMHCIHHYSAVTDLTIIQIWLELDVGRTCFGSQMPDKKMLSTMLTTAIKRQYNLVTR